MTGATQTAQALGLEPATDGAKRGSEHMLPSGRVITWAMPDVLTIISFAGALPDPMTAAVIKLLLDEGSYIPTDDPRYFHHRAEQLRAMYGIVQAGMVTPRFDTTREWGDGEALGRRDLPWMDVEYCYGVLFRIGAQSQPLRAPDPADAGRAAEPAPDRDGISPDAGGAAGDR